MKSLVAFFSLVAISSTVFAGGVTHRCEKEILDIAQANLNLKAKGYHVSGIDFGNIREHSLEFTPESKDKKHTTAKMSANIHVELFDVEVTVDEYCTAEKIILNDLGER